MITSLFLLAIALLAIPLPSANAVLVRPGDYVAVSGAELILVSYPDETTRRSGFSLDPGCADASLGPCHDIVVPLEHGGPAEGAWNVTVLYDAPHPMGGNFSIRFVIGDWADWNGGPIVATATCGVPTQTVHWVLDYQAESWSVTCDGTEVPRNL